MSKIPPTTAIANVDKILRELEDYYNTVFNGVLPSRKAMTRERAAQQIKQMVATITEEAKSLAFFEGVDAGIEDAKSSCMYHFAYSGRKTIKYNDLDKLFDSPTRQLIKVPESFDPTLTNTNKKG